MIWCIKSPYTYNAFKYFNFELFTLVLSNDRNKTVSVSEEDMKSCGAAYCPASLSSAPPTVNITELEPEPGNTNFDTSLSSIYSLAGIYLACSVTAALIIAIFVDPLTRCDVYIAYSTPETLRFHPISPLFFLYSLFKGRAWLTWKISWKCSIVEAFFRILLRLMICFSSSYFFSENSIFKILNCSIWRDDFQNRVFLII